MVGFSYENLELPAGHDCSGQVRASSQGPGQPPKIEYLYKGVSYDLSETAAGDTPLLFMARGEADLVPGVNRVDLVADSGVKFGLYAAYSCEDAGPPEVVGNLVAPSVTRVSPVSIPSNDPSNPVFTIGGLEDDDEVVVHTNATCTAPLTANIPSSGSTLTFAIGIGSFAEGTLHQLWANYTREGETSPCSSTYAEYQRDSTSPSVTVTSTVVGAKVAGNFPVTLTFSEAVIGLTESDISVSNGSVVGASLSGGGFIYNAMIDPSADGPVIVSMNASQVTDVATNPNAAASPFTLLNDETAPTISQISSPLPSGGTYDAPSTINITVTFSEVVSDGGASTLTLNVPGTVASYVSGSGTAVLTYQYVVAPGDFSPGALNVTSVDLSTVADDVGNVASNGLPAAAFNLAILENLTIAAPYNFTVIPLYANAPDWNDYVRYLSAAAGPLGQGNPAACVIGTDTGFYGESGGCLHGGELRKVIIPADGLTCTDLYAIDALGAFDWKCVVDGANLKFISKGLKSTKGLQHLVASNNWLPNNVFVKTVIGNVVRGQSAPQAWWGNPIEPLTGGSGLVTTLSDAGKIYVMSGPLDTGGIKISANKISIVTTSGGLIRYNSSFPYNMDASCTGPGSGFTSRLICADPGTKYLWIEAELTDLVARLHTALSLQAVLFSRVNKTVISGLGASQQPVVWLWNAGSTLLKDVTIQNFGINSAIKLDMNASNNILRDVSVGRNNPSSPSIAMISLESAPFNRLHNVRVAGGFASGVATGVHLGADSDGTVVSGLNVSNIKGGASTSGLLIASSDNVVHGLTATATSDAGLRIVRQGSAVSDNIVRQATFINNYWNGVFFEHTSGAISNTYLSNLAISASDTGITYTGTPTGSGNFLRDVAVAEKVSFSLNLDASFGAAGYIRRPAGSCGAGGAFTDAACAGTSATLVALPNLSPAFKGRVTADDAENFSDGSAGPGKATLAGAQATTFDWINFASPFRSWGREAGGVALSTLSVRDACTSDSAECRVWDFRVVSSSDLHNKSFDYSAGNGAFTASANCPTALFGNNSDTWNGQLFLRHAVEDLDSIRGDHDGLCESNEDCLYAPNIGAYIGEGTLTDACIFQPGASALTGIMIRAYPTTAVP